MAGLNQEAQADNEPASDGVGSSQTAPLHSHEAEMNGTATSLPIRLLRGVSTLAVLSLLVGLTVIVYLDTQRPVTLVIDGAERRLYTHQETVGGALLSAGLYLFPEDLVFHGRLITESTLSVPLDPDLPIVVERARPVTIIADGHTALVRTHASSPEDVLQEAEVSLLAGDDLQVNGAFVPGESTGEPPQLVELKLRRATPFTVHENGEASTYYTTASTVGEALWRAGIILYVADGVSPGLGEPMSPGLSVYLDRSVPVTVRVDGHTLDTRSLRQRVDELLAELGIVLAGRDRTVPAPETTLGEDIPAVEVVRVTEQTVIEQESIAFETLWRPDPNLELDTTVRYQEGARGVLERRVRVLYENGRPVAREVEQEYVALMPVPSMRAYGTNIVTRTLATPHGTIQYWRKIRMLATSYSASTAGTPTDSPWYGWTRVGLRMRHGLVAVDPDVVALMSNIYVPGYGPGLAADTGGAINGRRIDLGYDDDNLVLWLKWVDVYVLTPVPPPDEINYILPP
jgi:uncharacterized protein YabE (DUF348 family)